MADGKATIDGTNAAVGNRYSRIERIQQMYGESCAVLRHKTL
jgi:hypothetical protein